MSGRQFIIYDLEATCWRSPKPRQVEIIEIGAVKVNEELEIVDEFCMFIKPLLHPKIDKFCTKLTSITQDDVEDAPHFDEVIAEFEKWMDVDNTRTALFSWGDFDRRQFVKDAQLHELDLTWLKYWACLQSEFASVAIVFSRQVMFWVMNLIPKISRLGNEHNIIDRLCKQDS